MADRKDELERKRQKLAELRKSREDRKVALQRAVAETSTTTATTATTATAAADVDELVASLVGSSAATAPVLPDATSAMAAAAPAIVSSEPAAAGKRVPLKLIEMEQVLADIPPKEVVLYSKESQTDAAPEPDEEEQQPPSMPPAVNGNTHPGDNNKEGEEEEEDDDDDDAVDARGRKSKGTQTQLDMTDDEKQRIVDSSDFLDFFDRSTKIVERALNEPFDVLKDYTALDGPHQTDKDAVKLLVQFFDDRLSAHRAVTDLHWSPKHPELLLASYNGASSSLGGPAGAASISNNADGNGLVLVWSIHLPERPEFTFEAQAPVLATRFSPYQPSLIVGSTYTGQLNVWDMRAKSLPVDKTSLSSNGHTHPVYQLEFIGTANAHNVVSISTDGLFCAWSLDMLAKPQETMDLTNATVEVAATSFGFAENESSLFVVGTEEGNIYQASRLDRAGMKAGLNVFDVYKGHFGPVTSIHYHPTSGAIDFSDLVLSTSTDWTTKLWRIKSTAAKPSTTTTSISPLHSFEYFTDNVYDARWSPVHPAMFAAVDGEGRLTLWNINVDAEIPINVINVPIPDGHALNKVRWHADGRRLAVGSSHGAVFVYELGENAVPRLDEWTLLQRNLAGMTASLRQRESTTV